MDSSDAVLAAFYTNSDSSVASTIVRHSLILTAGSLAALGLASTSDDTVQVSHVTRIVSTSIDLPLPHEQSGISLEQSLERSGADCSLIKLTRRNTTRVFNVRLLRIVSLLTRTGTRSQRLRLLDRNRNSATFYHTIRLNRSGAIRTRHLIGLRHLIRAILTNNNVSRRRSQSKRKTNNRVNNTLAHRIGRLNGLTRRFKTYIRAANNISRRRITTTPINLVRRIMTRTH